jgi:RNA polymerase sigma-70 factor (ECF subfamily)
MKDRNRQIVEEMPGLNRYALTLTSDREEARDLVQDCLEKALRSWSSWRGDGALRAWLFSIMHNQFINSMRKRARWRMVISDGDIERAAAPEAQMDTLYLKILQRALEALSDDQREVLFLVVSEGLTYEQTAQATKVPIGTVMSRLSRARETLRKHMDEEAEKERLDDVQIRLR